ncbi:hypothetical protein POUND7_020208 [Theobroma cacao]
MDGTLLRGRSFFPYFALVAFEVGGILRLLFLLLASPLAGTLYYFTSESHDIRVLIFATFVGMKVSDIESVARAVLPKFYSSDLHPGFRFMWEEMCAYGDSEGHSGVKSPGVLVGKNKADALENESHVVPAKAEAGAVSHDKLPKPIVFHDGRLVQNPTPFMALLTILWIPVGFLLACLRIAVGILLPTPLVYYAMWPLGFRIHIKGTPPQPAKKSIGQTVVLFACSHRTLLDPIALSVALCRPIPTATYSISGLSEIISPIKTARLCLDRATDASIIKKLLEKGDLVICPEGTKT